MTRDPIIHVLTEDDTAQAGTPLVVRGLVDREREREGTGLFVVVHVAAGGNDCYARVSDEASAGNLAQRRVQHKPRGAVQGVWTEAHHPRAEAAVGEWKDAHAKVLDRLLIDYGKRAWKLDATAPYVVEFAPVPLAECGLA